MTDAPIASTAGPAARSSVAERMRRHRQRRRDGLKCYIVQVRLSELDELIRRGLLQPDCRDNPHDVIDAIHQFFDENLSGNPLRP